VLREGGGVRSRGGGATAEGGGYAYGPPKRQLGPPNRIFLAPALVLYQTINLSVAYHMNKNM